MQEVKKLIDELKPNTSPGADKIDAVIIKELKDVLIPILSKIYNKALEERKPL